MIEIDDSGWGSLLGGVMIGVYDNDNRKFYHGLIPVKYFQGTLFSKGTYRNKAVSIFTKILDHISLIDSITVCRGTCLDGIWEYVKNGVPGVRMIDRKEIGDPLQCLLEIAFAKSLKRIGVPQRTDGAHCLSFDDQLKWVYEDPSRVKYVKTGWSSWKKKYSINIK